MDLGKFEAWLFILVNLGGRLYFILEVSSKYGNVV